MADSVSSARPPHVGSDEYVVCVHSCTVQREAPQLFSNDLLQDVTIERQIGQQLFQLGILMAQRPELTDSATPSPANCFFHR